MAQVSPDGGGCLRTGVFAPLRHPDFAKLWVGQMVSVVGDKLNQIAMGIMVYKLTGSMLQMGIMLGITVLPSALFGLVAGAYVDRWDYRRTMIGADLLRAGLVFLIPWVISASGNNVYPAYALAFSVATVALFFEPAKFSIIPKIVSDKELLAANSLDNATSAISELAGLALAGAVVGVLGYATAFTIDAVSYLFSAACIALIARGYRRVGPAAEAIEPDTSPALTAAIAAEDPLATQSTWLGELLEASASRRSATGSSTHSTPMLALASAEEDPGRGVLDDVAAGARYIWRTPLLRDLLALWAFAALGLGASMTLSYGLALERYQAGAFGLALLDGAITVGLLIGTLLVGRGDPEASGTKLLGGLTAFALLFGATAFAPTIWVAAALFLLGGIANMWFLVPSITVVQRVSREDLRGRVLAARTTIARMASAVSIVAAGVAVQSLGIPYVILFVAALVLGAAAWGWTRATLRGA